MLSCRSLVEREAEFDICVYQIIECEAPVATAGVWQDPRLNVSDPYRLASPTNVCDIHHRRKSTLSEKRDRARRDGEHSFLELEAGFAKFPRCYFTCLSRRSTDNCRDAVAILEETAFVLRSKADIGEAGEV